MFGFCGSWIQNLRYLVFSVGFHVSPEFLKFHFVCFVVLCVFYVPVRFDLLLGPTSILLLGPNLCVFAGFDLLVFPKRGLTSYISHF